MLDNLSFSWKKAQSPASAETFPDARALFFSQGEKGT